VKSYDNHKNNATSRRCQQKMRLMAHCVRKLFAAITCTSLGVVSVAIWLFAIQSEPRSAVISWVVTAETFSCGWMSFLFPVAGEPVTERRLFICVVWLATEATCTTGQLVVDHVGKAGWFCVVCYWTAESWHTAGLCWDNLCTFYLESLLIY